MRSILSSAAALAIFVSSGCVVVNPKGDVRMSALPESMSFSKHGSSNKTAYGPTLERVVKQQERVVKKLQKQSWKEVVEETSTWTEQVRMLSGYANTTHDPARFRTYCDQLLTQTQAIRDAGLHQDPIACNTAIHACDPVLNRLSQEFPTEITPAAGSVASPPPPSAGTSPNASPRPQVQVHVQAP